MTPDSESWKKHQSIWRKQEFDESNTLSNYDVSCDSSPERSAVLTSTVRTIFKSVSVDIERISCNASFSDLTSSLKLYNQISQRNLKCHSDSAENSLDLSTELIQTQSYAQHFGQLVHRCGDCVSSIISKRILRR